MLRIVLLALALAGCEVRTGPVPLPCTTEQFDMMTKYIAICNKAYEYRECFNKAQEAYCKKESK